jgi:hypothetical protein
MSATTKPTYYCLGTGELRCDGCRKEKNWQTLNEMPNEWRMNAQKEMTRIDSADCILSGRPFFEPAKAQEGGK